MTQPLNSYFLAENQNVSINNERLFQMYLNFKQSVCTISLVFLMAFSVSAAPGSEYKNLAQAALQEEQEQTNIYLKNIKIFADFFTNSDVDPDTWNYSTQNKYCSAASEVFSSGTSILVKGKNLSPEEKYGITNNVAYALGFLEKHCE